MVQQHQVELEKKINLLRLNRGLYFPPFFLFSERENLSHSDTIFQIVLIFF